MEEIRHILKRYWGYEAFRPLQEDIIRSVLESRDTLAILPTGGGKSLCFQVPALADEGLCLVISPLIALMKDQVDNLKKRGIPALLIHSGMKRADVELTLRNATHAYFRFLYLSPERLETSLFREYLPALNVRLIAVDEAHCISQWGYDFRPSYLRIAALREELPGVPLLALTASATPEVTRDICEKLAFRNEVVFRQSFGRKNLSYSVLPCDAKPARLLHVLNRVPGSALVYCGSRKQTVSLASLLQLQGISAAAYHAGLTAEERAARQKQWIDNSVRVMVCTNAFGMGIDKPDVRLVVHADLPDSPEQYYQEAGRAGRDGQKSYAVLLFQEKDASDLENLPDQRFPSLTVIRKVYQCLVQFLQIPAGTGEYRSYPFRFDVFIRNFNLSATEALYALKALEGDGWLEFNERNFTPATLVFTTGKSALYEFERSYPQHEPLLTTLLRTYEGVFDFPAFISEPLLAKLLRRDEADIRKELLVLASFGIISYTPRNDSPHIFLLRNRVPAPDLLFRETPYRKRREAFAHRVERTIAYARTEDCRSRFLASYFGEADMPDCGVCDNCLRKKAGPLSSAEFEEIEGRIRTELSRQSLTATQLVEALRLRREKTWEVLRFLQREEKIESDEQGLLRLK